ncbi:copper chaperone PCu(A)C [Fuscibacter oryzae]|uniref:Copper chaperone PCu(A)C n=1 Tax=Fuscibacter oryzae TaxID=2803939 RepID=A0A8J7MW16_9RHOB|nr:copper chaperone PCu(A)C [Fuscibacter oryzae]MBL4928904.1 copper chaperone PCu(A)C [Fuscibacter oryzae]
MTSIRTFLAAAAAALALAQPALAHDTHPEGIHIHDAYARVNGGMGKTGAVFFMIHNNTGKDLVITGVASDAAKVVELHTHVESADGVMQMNKIEGGVPLPQGEMHEFARGGDHIMLMGLTKDLKDGDKFAVTLTFDDGETGSFEAVVDNQRKAGASMDMDGMMMDGMDHSAMGHSSP